jgi:hypothetical protein
LKIQQSWLHIHCFVFIKIVSLKKSNERETVRIFRTSWNTNKNPFQLTYNEVLKLQQVLSQLGISVILFKRICLTILLFSVFRRISRLTFESHRSQILKKTNKFRRAQNEYLGQIVTDFDLLWCLYYRVSHQKHQVRFSWGPYAITKLQTLTKL